MTDPSAPYVAPRLKKTAAVKKVSGWLAIATLVLSSAAAIANLFNPRVAGPIQQAGQIVDAVGAALGSDDDAPATK